MGKRLPPADRDEIMARLQRNDERYEQISRILLGESISGLPGLLHRQITDEQTHKENREILHEIKKEIRSLRSEIKTLRDEFEWYRGVIRLPTTKKFWIGTVIILAILVLLSRWTSDAYNMIWNAILKYFNKNF